MCVTFDSSTLAIGRIVVVVVVTLENGVIVLYPPPMHYSNVVDPTNKLEFGGVQRPIGFW